MSNATITSIELRLAWLKDHYSTWENNLKSGSTDPTYSVSCTAKMLEAEAEMNGILYVIGMLGYNVRYSEDKIGHTVCELYEE